MIFLRRMSLRAGVGQAGKGREGGASERAAKDDGAQKAKVVGAGMKGNSADRAAFVKGSQPLYDEFEKEGPNGKVMMDATLRAGN